MLPKIHRMSKKNEIKEVAAKGEKFFSENKEIILKILGNEAKKTKVGFSIPKLAAKNAVKRNRIKRILREIFRKEISNIKPGFSILVYLNRKNGRKEINYKEAAGEIKKILKRANLIIKK
ncbi:MAG: ribonuclease P protein component [Candidatus Moranbacteria bacterium RIFCSPHIGHO2_02_FULL_40_12b]|nr:MAG: ribonuclease P protein component [Candidatus Moranbacteria bacterium RIFCSPHIGHO2_02_FULL_40_12b]OGI22802.1 MAG: ribonuclease P protein component [Candidatus Moranbacteria bacterium RIFCSPHIGHO2_12_FULL_40_10]